MVETQSVAERFAVLSEDEREKLMGDIEPDQLTFSPEFWLRPKQLRAFHSDSWIIAAMAGRGFGKTRLLSEWVRSKAEKTPGTRISLIARTVADVRDTMVQGDSGILAVHPLDTRPEYIPSVRKLVWPNGSIAITHSAEEPSQLRGPSYHYAACDELAAWKHLPDDSGATAWDHVQIGTRLGDTPQIFVATTPKRVKVIRELTALSKVASNNISLFTGSTMDNKSNLPPEYIDQLVRMYEGTALEQQELYGILLDFVEGALWRDSDLEPKVPLPDDEKFLKVVSVDPGVTSGGDATGIVVCYATNERKAEHRTGWVVDDLTEPGLDPEEWAKNVVMAHHTHKGSVVVVEGNQGGELVRTVINQIDSSVPVITIHASKSKAARAEPVVIAYRMDRVKHVREFVELEDELTGWEPGSKWSPNRLDAMVHGLRTLLIDDTDLNAFGRIRTSSGHYNNASIAIPGHMRRHGAIDLGSWRNNRRHQ